MLSDNYSEPFQDGDDERVLSVSEVNGYIKTALQQDPRLSAVVIQGEVSGSRVYPSGHRYFSVRDAQSALKCVLFKGGTGGEFLEDGAQVLVYGRISYYTARGDLQLYVDSVKPHGQGALAKALAALKAKLNAEGLFDEERKRPLPRFPQHIAVVTSPSGAALQDILKILRRRYPLGRVTLLPATVQGVNTARSVVECLTRLREIDADLCILARGGGSPEDLWGFNDESVARAVFACPVPIITGVGHEIDTTIVDLVADKRAPTPSAAAEQATPDKDEILATINSYTRSITTRVKRALDGYREEQRLLEDRLTSAAPDTSGVARVNDLIARLENAQMLTQRGRTQRLGEVNGRLARVGLNPRIGVRLSETIERMDHQTQVQFKNRWANWRVHNARLDGLSPFNILKRGYSVVRLSGGKVLKNAANAKPGSKINIKLYRGELGAVVDVLNPGYFGDETATSSSNDTAKDIEKPQNGE